MLIRIHISIWMAANARASWIIRWNDLKLQINGLESSWGTEGDRIQLAAPEAAHLKVDLVVDLKAIYLREKRRAFFVLCFLPFYLIECWFAFSRSQQLRQVASTDASARRSLIGLPDPGWFIDWPSKNGRLTGASRVFQCPLCQCVSVCVSVCYDRWPLDLFRTDTKTIGANSNDVT